MNDAMSFGIHRLWKDTYVSGLNPRGGIRCLDVAGGTGESRNVPASTTLDSLQ